MINGIIYQAKNKVNGKVYIGQTVRSFEIRKDEHFRFSKRGFRSIFYNAVRKHGFDNFEWSILAQTTDRISLDNLERSFIKEAKSTNLKYGYNQAPGGFQPPPHVWTEEDRKRCSIRYSGSGNPIYGKLGKDNPKFISFDSEKINSIIELYVSGKSIDYISSLYKVNWNKIRYYLKENGVQARTRTEVMKLLPQNKKKNRQPNAGSFVP